MAFHIQYLKNHQIQALLSSFTMISGPLADVRDDRRAASQGAQKSLRLKKEKEERIAAACKEHADNPIERHTRVWCAERGNWHRCRVMAFVPKIGKYLLHGRKIAGDRPILYATAAEIRKGKHS